MRVEFAFILVALSTGADCGRYTPPTNPREYDFPYTSRVPNVRDLIEHAGFRHDQYKVITGDGHILSLHRLSPPGLHSKRRGVPVLFVNGYCFQSEGWMGLGRNTSLPFILTDLGYDVWLGDERGSSRSIGHIKYSLDDVRTYSYTFHEMGIYDLPAFIDHILRETGHDRLLYVGLSLGSGIFTILESELPAYRQKVIGAVFLGPAIHLTNWQDGSLIYYGILRVFDSMIEAQIKMKKWLLLANEPVIKTALQSCSLVPVNLYLSGCLTGIGLNFGRFTGNMNATTGGVQLASVVTSTSVFVSKHLFQVLKTGEFRKYDYGNKKMNMLMYGTEKPPKYDLSKIKTPLLVMYGSVDNMAAPDAVERSIEDMTSSPMERYLLDNFNHIDFLFGRRAPKEVYVRVVDFFDRLTASYRPNNIVDQSKPANTGVTRRDKN
ncbi:lipase 3-like [Nesidiocoris tenuis]|uniref:Lipase n=1 Tax=Nesidiocoris tenuis TaxID=355587 RepID=A0ABN7B4U8_9HEMI|nr:lipase 3-like [Nesidiocoris tenuis]